MALGLLLCTAWYYTILSGFFILYCPVMYLMFVSHRIYRKLVDILFSLWELYPVALFQCCFNTQLHHFGDFVNPDEKTIIVMNHRTRVDWNYVWIALYHATQNPAGEICSCKQTVEDSREPSGVLDVLGKSKIKFVLKDEIKTIPGMGWIMQLNFFLYVKRNWREDQVNLSQFADYYSKLNYDYRLVLFPEGTDLSDENRRRSANFASANNLQNYKFVLHPRTTGWVALCSRLRESGLASVYDITIAYDKPAQTEMDLLRGKIPTHVYFYCKRYSINKLPKDDTDLKIWLNDRWREKEQTLFKFHNEGHFVDLESNRAPQYRTPRSLFVAKIGFIFWTAIDVLFLYSLVNSVLFQFWVIYHCLLFIFITWYFGGFHNIQYKLLEKSLV
ncbi:lysocardiolipin acyltransferase 1-like [Trichoplusia ni]|uniref:Lysocardiolipin acyltransferase 1-like n=1 Tax=Trichoplusia ni TaxID=7111 RepID=A0A7E5W114_TRINI|nr:lysocardiolipin acyltransferase 1-like [Trichoplusia ni]